MASEVAQMDVLLTLKDEFSQGMKKASGSFKDASQQFKKAGAAITAIGVGGVLAIKGWVDAANTQIKAETQLNSVLKATENAAGFTADEIKNMASKMQGMTTIGDEAILTGQNMLLTFKNIGGETFPRATETLLDMATAMNGGATPSAEMLQAQAIQLGKALNDPIKGMASLSRVGVAFTEEQKNTIKTLQESGDLMGAQAVILKELEGEFGGAATAQAKTFQGQIQQLSNSFGDFKEELGMAVMPVLQQLIGVLGVAVEWFQNLSPGVKDMIAKFVLFGTALALVVGPILLLIGFLPAIAAGFGILATVIGTVALPITVLIAGMLALKLAWENDFLGIQEATTNAIAFIKEKFGDFIASVGLTIEDLKIKFEELKIVFNEFWGIYGETIMAAIELIKTTISIGMDFVLAKFKAVWELMKGTIKLATDIIIGVAKTAMQILTLDFSGAWETIKGTMIGAWETIKGTVGGIIDGIIGFVQKLIDKITSLINLLPFVNIGAKKFNLASSLMRNAAPGNLASGVTPLAEGGIATKPTLAMIAEGGESEAVIPLSKMDKFAGGGGGAPIIINNYGVISKEEQLIEMLNPVIRTLGLDNRH